MNRAGKFALENKKPSVATRPGIQSSIRQYLAKWNLLTHIHAQIAPKLTELIKRDEMLESIGHFDREAKTRPMNYKNQPRNGDFYSTGTFDKTDLASENNEIFAAINTIKKISRESKQATAII